MRIAWAASNDNEYVTEIANEDLDGLSEDEKEDEIHRQIQHDFDQRVTYVITNRG